MARIMIADDSATDRKFLALSLGRYGHELVEACDGEEAEDLFNRQSPDMLILDVVMPKKDGYQVCRSLKSQSRFANVPIIMISGMSEKSDEYWGRKQGANEYMSKPLDMQNLIETINKYLT
jgi:twitching motility two-component system response regulator PilH